MTRKRELEGTVTGITPDIITIHTGKYPVSYTRAEVWTGRVEIMLIERKEEGKIVQEEGRVKIGDHIIGLEAFQWHQKTDGRVCGDTALIVRQGSWKLTAGAKNILLDKVPVREDGKYAVGIGTTANALTTTGVPTASYLAIRIIPPDTADAFVLKLSGKGREAIISGTSKLATALGLKPKTRIPLTWNEGSQMLAGMLPGKRDI